VSTESDDDGGGVHGGDSSPMINRARVAATTIFLYLIYHDFAKIYGTPQILQKYKSVTVAHGVRDITPRPTAVGAARSGPLTLTPRATALRT
jgi:hypothetical protein